MRYFSGDLKRQDHEIQRSSSPSSQARPGWASVAKRVGLNESLLYEALWESYQSRSLSALLSPSSLETFSNFSLKPNDITQHCHPCSLSSVTEPKPFLPLLDDRELPSILTRGTRKRRLYELTVLQAVGPIHFNTKNRLAGRFILNPFQNQ